MPYANVADQRKCDARWRERNRELKRAINRTWRRRNKARNAQHVAAYARRKRERVFARCGWRCVYCGAADRLTVDHKLPLCRGGADVDRNKVAACFPCNRRKYRKTYSEFMTQIRAERHEEPDWITAGNPLALEDEERALMATR